MSFCCCTENTSGISFLFHLVCCDNSYISVNKISRKVQIRYKQAKSTIPKCQMRTFIDWLNRFMIHLLHNSQSSEKQFIHITSKTSQITVLAQITVEYKSTKRMKSYVGGGGKFGYIYIYIMKYIDTKIDLCIHIYIYKSILPQTWMGHIITH